MKDNAAYNRAYRKRHPLKAKAHTLVARQIRTGALVPRPCERCGEEKTHAHHEDYAKPLEVVWLCQPCHVERHKEMAAAAGFVPKQPTANKGTKYPKNTLLDRAKQLKAEGRNYPQIANELGVTKGTVYKWLNKVDYT